MKKREQETEEAIKRDLRRIQLYTELGFRSSAINSYGGQVPPASCI